MSEDRKKGISAELTKPLCVDDPEVKSTEYHDNLINGVIYRVWSAFEGKTDAEQSLGELMLRHLESENETEEIEEITMS